MWTPLQPILAQQDQGGGDLVKLLVVLLFFLGPAIKRALDERKASQGKKVARPPRPRPGKQPPGQRTWKELLEGRTPAEGQAPRTWQDLLDAEMAEKTPAAPVESRRPPVVQAEPESPEHWRPLVPETVLSDVAHEERLESAGAQQDVLLEAADALGALPTGWGVRPLSEVSVDTAVQGYESRQARSRRLLPRRGAWRRAVVLAEVLGPPLTARSSGQYPGPPAGWS